MKSLALSPVVTMTEPRPEPCPVPSEWPHVLTIPEVADILRCSKAHAFHVVNNKVAGLPRFPSLRIGRRVLVRRELFARWLEDAQC